MMNNNWMLLKSCLVIRVMVMFPFLFACASNIVAKEEAVIQPSRWQIKQAVSGCINLTGEYQQWSEDRPKGSKMPFSLSEMVGPYLSYDDLQKITYVSVEHRDDSEVTFTFFTRDGVLIQRKYFPSEKVQILCTADRVIIKKLSVETKGEATSGTADITDTYSLSDDGSLIVHKVTKWVDSILFVIRIPQEEEDWGRFKAVEKR